MKVKKKYAEGCLLFNVETNSAKINFSKVLNLFGVKKIFVEILDCAKKEPEFLKFLSLKGIHAFTKSRLGINICASLSEENFECFFEKVSKLKFEELKIWNANLISNENGNSSNLASFDSIFYIDYISFRYNYFEIVCDKSYDKDDLETKLLNILISE